MSTIVRTTTIYGQVVIEINIKCNVCDSVMEWKDGNFALNELYVSPCANCNDKTGICFDNILKLQLHELNWDRNAPQVRIVNNLSHEGINTVKDVVQTSKCLMRKIPNFGKKCMRYLEAEINKLGLKLHEGNYSDTLATKYRITTIDGVEIKQ